MGLKIRIASLHGSGICYLCALCLSLFLSLYKMFVWPNGAGTLPAFQQTLPAFQQTLPLPPLLLASNRWTLRGPAHAQFVANEAEAWLAHAQ